VLELLEEVELAGEDLDLLGFAVWAAPAFFLSLEAIAAFFKV
jgi:hypothetical protein